METTGSKRIDELVRRAIIGDGAAFTELWDTNIESLRAYLAGTLVKPYDSFLIDDICSRSFEKAFRQIHNFDPERSQFSTWLKAIAHNTALDTIEAEGRRNRNFVSIDDGEARLSVIDNVGDDASTPLDSIIRDEDQENLRRYVKALPELYRDIAFKRLIDGMQYKEIAEETGVELNTVRTRIRRAKALIDKMKESE